MLPFELWQLDVQKNRNNSPGLSAVPVLVVPDMTGLIGYVLAIAALVTCCLSRKCPGILTSLKLFAWLIEEMYLFSASWDLEVGFFNGLRGNKPASGWLSVGRSKYLVCFLRSLVTRDDRDDRTETTEMTGRFS